MQSSVIIKAVAVIMVISTSLVGQEADLSANVVAVEIIDGENLSHSGLSSSERKMALQLHKYNNPHTNRLEFPEGLIGEADTITINASFHIGEILTSMKEYQAVMQEKPNLRAQGYTFHIHPLSAETAVFIPWKLVRYGELQPTANAEEFAAVLKNLGATEEMAVSDYSVFSLPIKDAANTTKLWFALSGQEGVIRFADSLDTLNAYLQQALADETYDYEFQQIRSETLIPGVYFWTYDKPGDAYLYMAQALNERGGYPEVVERLKALADDSAPYTVSRIVVNEEGALKKEMFEYYDSNSRAQDALEYHQNEEKQRRYSGDFVADIMNQLNKKSQWSIDGAIVSGSVVLDSSIKTLYREGYEQKKTGSPESDSGSRRRK